MFEELKQQVENSIGMYASGYVTFPAWGLYESDTLKEYQEILDRCHIYLIGWCDRVSMKTFAMVGSKLVVVADIGSEERIAEIDVPSGSKVIENEDGKCIQLEDGTLTLPPSDHLIAQLGGQPFEVAYIGQSFGKSGERVATDRLIEHKKLQEISIKGDAKNRQLTLLTLEVADHQLFTFLNPHAINMDENDAENRISNGIDKLFETSEVERISLYEAALIRYFRPEFNFIFKESFPSTNLKLLNDCYEKDFCAVCAEICIDQLPFLLFSEKI